MFVVSTSLYVTMSIILLSLLLPFDCESLETVLLRTRSNRLVRIIRTGFLKVTDRSTCLYLLLYLFDVEHKF